MVGRVDVFHVPNSICASCFAPLLSSKTVTHVASNPGKNNLHTCQKNIASLTVSPSASHSALVVESVTHF